VKPDVAHAAILSAPAPAATSVSSARDAVAAWLLGDTAQMREGRERGAVAGWLDADGRASFVYPEITGYYLQWLAWHASREGPAGELRRRADAAQRWLATWLTGPRPLPTRVYLRPDAEDWRNRGVFCFDLAMALRGVGSAARLGLLAPDPVVVDGLCTALLQLEGGDGYFEACLPHDARQPLPARWSTRRGAFLAKAAAGIIAASPYLPGMPERLLDVAQKSFARSVQWMAERPHDEVHALIYAMEGVLTLPRHSVFHESLAVVSQRFSELLADIERNGRVPETRSAPGTPRLDIVAQTLRIAVLLEVHAAQALPASLLAARLAQKLAREVAPHGGVPFDPTAAAPQFNLWTSMFAEQALSLAHSRGAARTLADPEPLIV
jgi:hypothetical protein